MSLPESNYDVSIESEIIRLLYAFFGVSATLKRLNGDVDLNFLVKTEDGVKYLLKIGSANKGLKEFDLELKIMEYLNSTSINFKIPKVIKNKNGDNFFQILDHNGISRAIRLQSWIEGKMLDAVNPWSSHLLSVWGKLCGSLSKELANFDHPHAHRMYAWDPSNCLDSMKYSRYFDQEGKKQLANHFWFRFEKLILPVLPELRKSVNHLDAHEHNIIMSENIPNELVGLIDFGDAVYSATVNELAIACAYAMMRSPDPLRTSYYLIKGYHAIFPLQKKELSVLYDLIAARLLISVSHAANNAALNPNNAYLQVSQSAAWELLKKWHNISPDFAHYYFRFACSLEPCAKRHEFDNYLAESKPGFHPVITFRSKIIKPIDLSVSSTEFGHFNQVMSLEHFEKWIRRYREDHTVDILFGGYMEPRSFYSTDHYAEKGLYGPQWRTIHAGIDFWSESREPVYAVYPGKIKYLKNNLGLRNYGPTIILEHTLENGIIFYSLYGHLAEDSLSLYPPGTDVGGGQLIGYVGDSTENGAWPPHLHFQIMLDLLGMEGDFPGVVYPHEAEIWSSICPNPAILLDLEDYEYKMSKISVEHLLKKRKSHLGSNLSLAYNEPLYIVRGQMQYLLEYSGRKYLDTVNNVAHVGHEHPELVKAIIGQSAVLNSNTRYLHQNILNLAEQLKEKLPKNLEVLYFVNSGSEANELAVRMCEQWSGSKEMIVMESGYHGNTGRCIELSSYKFDRKGGKGAPDYTHVVRLPDSFRHLQKDGSFDVLPYLEDIRLALTTINRKGLNPAGIIAESIVSCGGQIELPPEYLKQVYSMVREAGGLCIADEVQTGLGRVGSHYWAFELHDVVPDIVTIGKPLGNGHPIAAVACTRAVAEVFSNGMEYFNTFGGNPVSCAAGSAVLRVIDDEDLRNKAAVNGAYWKSGLCKLQQKYSIIGDVRGQGLFLGFELIRNAALEPAANQANYLVNRMRAMGILMCADGPYNNVIKLKPPMCITQENIDLTLEYLEHILREDPLRI